MSSVKCVEIGSIVNVFKVVTREGHKAPHYQQMIMV